MNPEGSARSLIVRVAVVAVVLLGMSRWAGWALRPDRAGAGGDPAPEVTEEAAPSAGDAQQSGIGMDLSFYRSLAGPRPGSPAGDTETAPQAPPRISREEAPPSGAWVVQALATREERVARRLGDRLAEKGLPATLVEGSDGSATIWRVRVGRYRDREAAEAVARRVRRDHGLESWVLREAE